METRIRTTHTGSLPRPDGLADLLFDKHEANPVDGMDLDRRIHEAVVDAVGRQRAAGVDVVNDGEMSKVSYWAYVRDRLTGFGGRSNPAPRSADPLDIAYEEAARPVYRRLVRPACVGPIAYRGHDALQTDIDNLKEAVGKVSRESVFMTSASPGVIARFIEDQHYGNHETYLAAIVAAMREEYRAIVQAGVTLQLDCPDLTASFMGRGPHDLSEFRRHSALAVEALNHALAGLPSDNLRLHVCWGNFPGPHHHDVPLADIVDIVLQANVAGISVEASNPRHAHEYEVFDTVNLPEGKYLIPGVIDSTTNYVEHPDLVAQRLVRYAERVGARNVMAGSDCGFGTVAGPFWVVPPIVWAKFESMREGARRASVRLRTAS